MTTKVPSDRQRVRNPKDHFTIVPNSYDDADLSVYEFRLLVHYKRVGNCYESTRSTARKCRMSLSSVVKARRGLAERNWIRLAENDLRTIDVEVIDRWSADAPTSGGTIPARSPHERGRASSERSRSPGSIKEESLEEDTSKKRRGSAPLAVEVFRIFAHRYPRKQSFGVIERTVGDGLLRWARIIRRWVGQGSNPANVTGMLDVFRNGWRANGSAGRRDPNYSAAADVAAFKKERGLK
jgi:hypothetical protein